MDRHEGVSTAVDNVLDRLRMLAKLMRASDDQCEWTEGNVQALFRLIEAQLEALEVEIATLKRAAKAKAAA